MTNPTAASRSQSTGAVSSTSTAVANGSTKPSASPVSALFRAWTPTPRPGHIRRSSRSSRWLPIRPGARRRAMCSSTPLMSARSGFSSVPGTPGSTCVPTPSPSGGSAVSRIRTSRLSRRTRSASGSGREPNPKTRPTPTANRSGQTSRVGCGAITVSQRCCAAAALTSSCVTSALSCAANPLIASAPFVRQASAPATAGLRTPSPTRRSNPGERAARVARRR